MQATIDTPHSFWPSDRQPIFIVKLLPTAEMFVDDGKYVIITVGFLGFIQRNICDNNDP